MNNRNGFSFTLIFLMINISCSLIYGQESDQDLATTPKNQSITRLGAGPVKKFDFSLTDVDLFWEHTYSLPIKRDSIIRRLKLTLFKKPEVRLAAFDDNGIGTLMLEKWELDTKAAGDTAGGFSKIYRSGKWTLYAQITVRDNEYTVMCKDIIYFWRGLRMPPNRYVPYEVKTGLWRSWITKRNQYKPKEENSILLVHQNLLRYFGVAEP